MAPHLSLPCPIVVTFHELAHSHTLRKLSSLLFLPIADSFVFCCQEDRDYYHHKVANFRRRSFTIPIGSNIPSFNGAAVREENVVMTFGQIRPRKGIEQFIELARLSRAEGGAHRFLVIGATLGRFHGYCEQLRARIGNSPPARKLALSPVIAVRFGSASRVISRSSLSASIIALTSQAPGVAPAANVSATTPVAANGLTVAKAKLKPSLPITVQLIPSCFSRSRLISATRTRRLTCVGWLTARRLMTSPFSPTTRAASRLTSSEAVALPTTPSMTTAFSMLERLMSASG